MNLIQFISNRWPMVGFRRWRERRRWEKSLREGLLSWYEYFQLVSPLENWLKAERFRIELELPDEGKTAVELGYLSEQEADAISRAVNDSQKKIRRAFFAKHPAVPDIHSPEADEFGRELCSHLFLPIARERELLIKSQCEKIEDHIREHSEKISTEEAMIRLGHLSPARLTELKKLFKAKKIPKLEWSPFLLPGIHVLSPLSHDMMDSKGENHDS